MVAELAGLMPEEGGYYVWVRENFGAVLGSAGRLVGHGVRGGSHGHFSRFVCELFIVFLSEPGNIGGQRTSRNGSAGAVAGGGADDRVGDGRKSAKREGRRPDGEGRCSVRAWSFPSDDPHMAEAGRASRSAGRRGAK